MNKQKSISLAQKIALFVGIVLFLILSLGLMGEAFKGLGRNFSTSVLSNVNSPLLGFFIGILATAIVQSSSLVTSTIVTLVITGLSLENAVPIVLGANIGTTVTSSIMAFGHISNRKEYKRAVAAATVHDFFNVFTAILLFPLEIFFGILSKPAAFLASQINLNGFSGGFNVVGYLVSIVEKFVFICIGENYYGILLFSFVLLFIAFKAFSLLFKRTVNLNTFLDSKKDLFKSDFTSLLWGLGFTSFVQSSSITSSLIVPFVAAKKVKLEKAFSFLMGVNLGTTTTAFYAVIASPSEVGLTIAFVHLLFNVIGVGLFYPFAKLRELPLGLAQRLGEWSFRNRLFGVLYVIITFFLFPLMLYSIFN